MRLVAVIAILFLPACDGCSSCEGPEHAERAPLDPTPRASPAPGDTNPARFFREPILRRKTHDGGVRDAGALLE